MYNVSEFTEVHVCSFCFILTKSFYYAYEDESYQHWFNTTIQKPSKTHQGEVVPSWEDKTGLHLVDPDDESVY